MGSCNAFGETISNNYCLKAGKKDQNKNTLWDINTQSNVPLFDKKLINLTSERNRKYTVIKPEWQIKVTLKPGRNSWIFNKNQRDNYAPIKSLKIHCTHSTEINFMGKKTRADTYYARIWKNFWNKTHIHEGVAGSGRAKMAEQRQPVLPGVTQLELNPDRKLLLSCDWKIEVMDWNLDNSRDAAIRKKRVKEKNTSVKKETWLSHPTRWERLAGTRDGRYSQENWGKSDRQQQGALSQSNLRAAQTSTTWKEFCVPKIRGISIVPWLEAILEGHMKAYCFRKPKFLYFLFPASQTHVSSHFPGNWVPISSVRHLKEAHWKQIRELGRWHSLQSVRQIGEPVFDPHDHKNTRHGKPGQDGTCL